MAFRGKFNILLLAPSRSVLVVYPCYSNYPMDVSVNSKTGVIYGACYGFVLSIIGSGITRLTTSSQCSNPNAVFANSGTGILYAACSTGVISIDASMMVTTLTISNQCANPQNVYSSYRGPIKRALRISVDTRTVLLHR